jgi:hypothetical protein
VPDRAVAARWSERAPVGARKIGTAVNVGALGIGPLLAGFLAQWVMQPLTLPYLLFDALGAVALIGVAAAPETGAPALVIAVFVGLSVL